MAKGLSDLAASGGKEKSGYLSHEAVKKQLEEQRHKRVNKYITGIYGNDGTAKTGIALTRRSQDDIDTERPLYLFDFDLGATPVLDEYYPQLDANGKKQLNEFGDIITDPGIVVVDPIVRHTNGAKRGAIDPESSIQKAMSMIFYIQEEGPGERNPG